MGVELFLAVTGMFLNCFWWEDRINSVTKKQTMYLVNSLPLRQSTIRAADTLLSMGVQKHTQSERGALHLPLKAQDHRSPSEDKKRTAVIVTEMQQNVLIVFVKLRVQNERHGLD